MNIRAIHSSCRPCARYTATTAFALTLIVATMGCGGGAPADTAANGGRGGPGAGGRGSGPPALPTMAVAVQAAAGGEISTYYKATASLDPDKQAVILARTSGVVQELQAEEGDFVASGQVLLQLEDDEYRHRVTLAEVEVEEQRLRFERSEKMLEQGLVAKEDFDTTRTALQAAEASLELAALELSYTAVRSPFAGRVVHRAVDLGNNVSNGTHLFTIADMSRLLARVHVPAKEFRSIRTDQPVSLVVSSTGDRLQGRIDLVSPLVDPTSGTIKVTVEVRDYPASTRPGDFVEVAIVTDRHSDVITVPRIAVVTERGISSVFVATGETAEQRQVELGFEDDKRSEIVSGLELGEQVVVQGQRALRDGQPITILESLDLDADQAEVAAEAHSQQPG